MTTHARIGFATALALALTLGTTVAVRAATLTITSDKSTYGVGETVSLTVVGDTQGASDTYILGSMFYSSTLLSANGDNAQNTLTSFDGA